MDAPIVFVASASMKDVATALGVTFEKARATECHLMVGDVIAQRDRPGMFFRITGRLFVAADTPEESGWLLTIEQTPDPLDALDRTATVRPLRL